jgi:hypothetical protein
VTTGSGGVGQGGLEPPTSPLSGVRSNQAELLARKRRSRAPATADGDRIALGRDRSAPVAEQPAARGPPPSGPPQVVDGAWTRTRLDDRLDRHRPARPSSSDRSGRLDRAARRPSERLLASSPSARRVGMSRTGSAPDGVSTSIVIAIPPVRSAIRLWRKASRTSSAVCTTAQTMARSASSRVTRPCSTPHSRNPTSPAISHTCSTSPDPSTHPCDDREGDQTDRSDRHVRDRAELQDGERVDPSDDHAPACHGRSSLAACGRCGMLSRSCHAGRGYSSGSSTTVATPTTRASSSARISATPCVARPSGRTSARSIRMTVPASVTSRISAS